MKFKKIFSFVICISFFSVFLKAQTEGDVFYGMAQVHEVHMDFTQASYWDSLVNYMPQEKYLKGNIIIDGVALPDAGIKFKGNSSYNNPSDKKSFKVDLNEFVSGQKVDGLKKFNLNNGFKDPSFMREKMALDFYNEHGIAAPRCAYARVYINGVYWGLYTFVEEVNKTFLDDDGRFGNKQGNLFKGDPSGDLKWTNSSASSYYPKYELHTNETANDWSDLVNFINKINNSGAYFYDSLETVFNTTTFIKHWAAMNVFANLDSYLGSGHNYFIYHDTLSNKFEWISWDVNESFGNFNMGMNSTQIKNLSMFYLSNPVSSRPLIQKMVSEPVYKARLVSTICQWLESDFTNETLDPKVDSLASVIRADVYSDTKKFFSNMDFETNLTSDAGPSIGIKSFITARRDALMTELAVNGCSVGIKEKDAANKFRLFPNPASEAITIEFLSSTQKNEISIYNLLGELMFTKTGVSSGDIIETSLLSSGVYILKLNNASVQRLEIIH